MFQTEAEVAGASDEQCSDGIVGLMQNCIRKYGVADGDGRE